MWDVRVCVACLATDVRMYSMSASSLLQPYQLLAGVQFDDDNDYMPQKLCWECAALVNKFILFRDKSERSYLLLQDIYNRHDELSERYVKDVDREQHQLSTQLRVTQMPSYTLRSRGGKGASTRSTTTSVKKEFEPSVLKTELVECEVDPTQVKCEEDYKPAELLVDGATVHFGDDDDDSDGNDEDNNCTLGELKIKKEGAKKVSLKEIGWTEVTMTREEAMEVYTQRKNLTKYKRAKHKCELCYQFFHSQTSHKKHMAKHNPRQGPHECGFCKMRFSTQKKIARHMLHTHTKKYTCNRCQATYYNRDVAMLHLKLHQKLGPVLKRRIVDPTKRRRKPSKPNARALYYARKGQDPNDFQCVEKVQTQEEIMEVVRKRQFTEAYKNSPFKCTLCFKVFLEAKTYGNHMKQHDPGSGDFECDICKIRVKSKAKLRTHITDFHSRSYSCKICPNVSYNRCVAKNHYQCHEDIKHVCHVCGAAFSRGSALENHVHRKHQALTSHNICVECGSSFPTMKGLIHHKRLMHQIASAPQEKGPYCEECKVQFSSMQAWIKHVFEDDKHKDLKKKMSNVCRHCGETFPSLIERSKHVAIQHPTAERSDPVSLHREWPQPCTVCAEPMVNRLEYWYHFRRAHRGHEYPLRIKSPHVCEQCGKNLQSRAQLRAHRRVHTGVRPYPCPLCPKTFYTPDLVKKHLIIHSEERPFECDICGKGFKFKGAMERHMIVHTGARPHACNVCGKTFTTRYWTQLHIRKVHYNEHIPYKPRVRNHNAKPSPRRARRRADGFEDTTDESL